LQADSIRKSNFLYQAKHVLDKQVSKSKLVLSNSEKVGSYVIFQLFTSAFHFLIFNFYFLLPAYVPKLSCADAIKDIRNSNKTAKIFEFDIFRCLMKVSTTRYCKRY